MSISAREGGVGDKIPIYMPKNKNKYEYELPLTYFAYMIFFKIL
jgi:hypothetical protein